MLHIYLQEKERDRRLSLRYSPNEHWWIYMRSTVFILGLFKFKKHMEKQSQQSATNAINLEITT